MPIQPCHRKDLIRIPIDWHTSLWKIPEFAPTTPRGSPVMRLTLPRLPKQRPGTADMSLVRFPDEATATDIVEYATSVRQRRAYPQELLAIAKAAPFLTSDLDRTTTAVIALHPCLDPEHSYEYDNYEYDDDGQEKNTFKVFLGIRWLRHFTAQSGNRRIAHAYHYEFWPSHYYFLLVDRIPARS